MGEVQSDRILTEDETDLLTSWASIGIVWVIGLAEDGCGNNHSSKELGRKGTLVTSFDL